MVGETSLQNQGFYNPHWNRFLCGTPEGKAELRAVRNAWENFEILELEHGNVAIKSVHGFYLSAQPNGNLDFNRTEVDIWETFKKEDKGECIE